MKIEKLSKENIKDFLGDLNIEDSYLESNVNKLEVFGIKEENTFYMAFEMVLDDDRIAIKYINNKLTSDKFFECINYLNNSLVVNSHLIINIYDKYYSDILSEKYRCKDVYVSSVGKIIEEKNLKEEYIEIDMMNIRYYVSNGNVLCNLVRQNIQNENVINIIDSSFKHMDINNISFVIFDLLEPIFEDLGYKLVYKSFVIED